jgi:hypothetical protein
MNINRNNYEEYFLLYADNELSQKEKNEVELFVQENMDLEEEFNMIKLTINIPDEKVSMADKSFLIKNELSSFINENNYEEVFVLYHDNELSEQQKNKTEEFLNHNSRFQIDFELIGKAKLDANAAIIFPDKKQLYRKEKDGKVIPLILWRSMAAAVVIGFGFWITTSYFNQKEGTRAVAFEQENIQFPEAKAPKLNSGNPLDSKEENLVSATKNEAAEKENKEKDPKENQRKIVPDEIKNAVVKTVLNKKIPTEEKAIPLKKDSREILAASVPIAENPDRIIATTSLRQTNPNEHVDRLIQPMEQPVSYAQNASYTIDNNSNDENYVFYNVKADEFNKTKVGGFLKKVKRIVERTNPIGRFLSGDDKQVASK